ncbi:MAG: hypothetical protein IPK83_18890 [Planctomycetes bacterium]|nr:hypothetical protein [Planctomycetota bacterium]
MKLIVAFGPVDSTEKEPQGAPAEMHGGLERFEIEGVVREIRAGAGGLLDVGIVIGPMIDAMVAALKAETAAEVAGDEGFVPFVRGVGSIPGYENLKIG